MVTIRELAKATGYSVTTVSRALNGYTDISKKAKKIIFEKAKEMGYYPNSSARSLVTRRSYTIGVVFEEKTKVGITHPFFIHVLNNFKKYIEKRGYDILLISKQVGDQVNSYLDHCRQKNIDGILILISHTKGEGIEQLLESEIPSVIIDFDTDKSNCVYTNNYKSSYQSVKYLIDKGHKKIGYIHGDLSNFSGIERMKGYQKAMEDHDLPINKLHVFPGYGYSYDEGYHTGLQVANMINRPTALCCASDGLAIGFMRAMAENHIHIPNEISVVGFDDIDLAKYVYPGLTTIRQDTEELAIHSANILLEEIDKKKTRNTTTVIEGSLIERGSVRDLNE
ncbi:LacI family DNA-binding transcriptional regulator [Haloplasma contractile]|uniref:Alanine racemase protein n=1 Tax=Haloplasma contractile SSD-17B TaxID=1033810 RepID=F7PRN8_9MOLU|nr:LacI family DNA-binding transcriptional regulator [Haloplasma contractile]ERJ11882.1 alanine racemase protein [Haloplasma contractile SSD-17B]